jgi:hypothetical protein
MASLTRKNKITILNKKLKKNSGLYYKHMTIVNDNARVINKFEASITDNARVIIYDRHMFIEQATGQMF